MAQLSIRINGYAYNVSCEDGQEGHLQAMAQEIDNRIGSIKALGGQSGESRLLVLAALLMADELHDMGIELASTRRAATMNQKVGPSFPAPVDKRLAALTQRAEEIAAALERS